MARRGNKKASTTPRFPTTSRRTIRRVKRSRKPSASKPGSLKSVMKTIYQVVSALPILPAPVRSAADWVGRMFGLTSATGPASTFVMTDGVVNSIEWSGFVRSELLVTNNPLAGSYNEHLLTLSTNIRAVRPLSVSFTLTPQNPVERRSGYYTMGFIPVTGPNSVKEFRDLDKDQLGYERFLQRMPVKSRFPGSSKGTMTYTVPASNAFLHNGIPLRKVGDTTDSDALGFLVIVYRREDRVEYSDFSPDDVSFDLRVSGRCTIAQTDPLTPIDVYASRILKDYNQGRSRYVFRNPSTSDFYRIKTCKWNPSTKLFTAQASDLDTDTDRQSDLRHDGRASLPDLRDMAMDE